MSDYEKGLKKLSRELAELYAPSGVPKHYREMDVTFKAAEWIMPVLCRELLPLLEAVEKVANWTDDMHNSNHTALRTELSKWTK